MRSRAPTVPVLRRQCFHLQGMGSHVERRERVAEQGDRSQMSQEECLESSMTHMECSGQRLRRHTTHLSIPYPLRLERAHTAGLKTQTGFCRAEVIPVLAQ